MTVESAIINIITAGLVIYGWRSLPSGKIRLYFVLSVILIAFYKIYDPTTDSRTLLWLRHLPVYSGEILFYLFIVSMSSRYIEVEDAITKTKKVVLRQNILVLTPLIMFATGFSWYQFLTDEGLPHIFTLPLFVLVLSLVRLRLEIYDSTYTSIARLFTAAVGAWIMIHVSEFIVESQKLMSGLDSYMPQIEFFWFLIGAIVFWIALREFSHAQKRALANEKPIK
jgi:hypothetical protein